MRYENILDFINAIVENGDVNDEEAVTHFIGCLDSYELTDYEQIQLMLTYKDLMIKERTLDIIQTEAWNND